MRIKENRKGGCKMKRKILAVLSVLMCAALLAAALPPQSARAESALATGYVNSGKLNMRNGAGTGNPIVDTLTRNTAVNVYEVSGSWLRIDVPSTGKSGYVYGKYISIDETSLSAYGLGVTTGKVHLRKEANSKSDSLAIVDKNLGVTIYSADQTTGWYKVKVHATSQEGYISPRYIKLVCKVSGTAGTADSSGKGYVNAAQVNFRTGPSTSYSSQGKLDKYTGLTVTGTSGNWYHVTLSTSGKTGYVYKTYVTIGSTSATPIPVITSGTAGYINAAKVNFRTGPSTSYSSQGKLDKDAALTVTGSSGDWYQATLSSTGKSGYVYKTYVTIGTAATPTPTPTDGTAGTINANGVNFRTGPSTSYKSSGKLSKNTALTVLGVSGSWLKVKITSSGKTGYVFAKYVTISTATPSPTPTATPTPTPSYVIITPSPATPTPVTPSPATPSPATPSPAVTTPTSSAGE